MKKKEIKKITYNPDHSGWRTKLQCDFEGILIVSFFAYFFYRHWAAVLVLSPGIYIYKKEKLKKISCKRKRMLELQFKDTLLSVHTNLQAGYSVENAFVESIPYIKNLYGEKSDMTKELILIQKGLSNGNTLENLLLDFSKRCPQSAIEEFAGIYAIALRTGSGWSEVIGKIITGINQRLEIKQEIELVIHGKKVESRIMCVIPFIILIYMNFTSKGYFDVLYHNIVGVIIMTLCLAGYLLAFLWSEKITDL